MTVKEYEQRLPFINAWRERAEVCVSSADKTVLITMGINPTEHDDSELDQWVINDEYVNLRLALMRGKDIEYKHILDGLWDVVPDSKATRRFNNPASRYRVRATADTSWIKNKGFCRYKGRALQIKVKGNNVSIPQLQRYKCTKENFVRLYQEWKPEQDELCWFWNDDSYPALGEFTFKTIGYYFKEANANFKNIRPYLGEKFWEDECDNPDSKWRLPTIDELISAYREMDKESLDEFNRYCYWSSTINAHSDKIAWVLHFEDGYTNTSNKDATNHVIYVKDTCDGLEWGEANKKVATWDEALKYAKSINQMKDK